MSENITSQKMSEIPTFTLLQSCVVVAHQDAISRTAHITISEIHGINDIEAEVLCDRYGRVKAASKGA